MRAKIKRRLFLFLVIVLAVSFGVSGTAFARAGGGGSSGGGGGSSSGGSLHHSGRGGNSSPIELFISEAMFLLIAGSGTIVFVYRSRKARRKSIKLMKAYRKLGINWDYGEIQKHVEKAYFEIQESWKRYDPSYASDYLSEELAQIWKTKLEWMKIRGEEIVQKKVKLLSAIPVGVFDEDGEDNDRIWYLIHGKMIGYYRNRDTKELIRGNPRNEAFYEYWLFVRRNGRWVLHEIRQQDEVDIQEFLE